MKNFKIKFQLSIVPQKYTPWLYETELENANSDTFQNY